MLDKRPAGRIGKVLATFHVPAAGIRSVAVVGEFNSWSRTATPMQRTAGESSFTAELELEAGRAYRFRYLVDGLRWENDWSADDYVPNDYGGTDSVVDLRSGAKTSRGPPEAPVVPF